MANVSFFVVFIILLNEKEMKGWLGLKKKAETK